MQKLAITILLLLSAAPSLAAERPNIVLVMCDDLGWGDVGFNGGQTIHTPHLDEMSHHSLRFTRFYAQAPVCSPTRGSVITGRHPYRYGIPFANSGHMRPPELTLAELLREIGYVTGHFGKWHLGTLTKTVVDANRGGRAKNIEHYAPPQHHGFDVCFSTESKVPTFDPMLKPAKNAGSAWDSIADRSESAPYGTYYWNERGERVTDNLDGDNSRVIMDRAVPFIEKAVANQQPFFTIVWFHTPHLPVVAGPKHRAMYAEVDDVRARNYYGCVTAMDEQVGRLRDTLARIGVAENTLITFCSDNGPEGNSSSPGSAGPFRGRKRSLYEGGVRVPGLIEWPGRLPAGKETDFPAVTSDYLPTILEILGIELPDDRPIDGVSLVPVFSDLAMERSQPIGFESRDMVAFSDNRYKIFKDKSDQWELYDLLADPGEQRDLAGKHPDIVRAMAAAAEAWRSSCAASDAGEDYPEG